MSSPKDVPAILERLVSGWCARRALAPLRHILPAYPAEWDSTDACNRVLEAMKDVRGLSHDALTPDEDRDLTRAINSLQTALGKR
jgi:hypothetical protein